MLIQVTQQRLSRFRAVCKQCGIVYSEDEIRSECSAWLNYFAHLEEFAQAEEQKKVWKNNSTPNLTNNNRHE